MDIGLHEVLMFVYLWVVCTICLIVGGRYYRRKKRKAPIVIASFVVSVLALLAAEPLISLILD